MTHRGARVDPAKIRRVALLTIEGENDDISGVGQTEAAHRICANIPSDRKAHWLQPAVGHYGVFNGSRFRAEIVPRISDFVLSNNTSSARIARKLSTGAKTDGKTDSQAGSTTAAASAGNGSAAAERSALPDPELEASAAAVSPRSGAGMRH
jgi:poly(3-hydroxybutyrate) depolymerase